MSEAEDGLKLALLSSAAQQGATDDDLRALLARMNGEALVALPERGRGTVQVKVSRVHAIAAGDSYAQELTGLCRVFLTPSADGTEWPPLLIDMPQDTVARRLREAGWAH